MGNELNYKKIILYKNHILPEKMHIKDDTSLKMGLFQLKSGYFQKCPRLCLSTYVMFTIIFRGNITNSMQLILRSPTSYWVLGRGGYN